MAALKELDRVTQTDEFFAAQELIFKQMPQAMRDPEFRYQVMNFAAATEGCRELIEKASALGNVYENMGRLIRHNLVNSEFVFEAWSPAIVGDWENLQDLIALRRRDMGDKLWENFEYLSVRAEDWLGKHPKGTITLRWRHKDLKDKWRDDDLAYGQLRESKERRG